MSRVRGAFRRLPLRVHLVLVVVVLAAAGLLGTWVIGSKVMQDYLLGQVDARLSRMSAQAERQMVNGLDLSRPGRGFVSTQLEVVQFRRADGFVLDLSPRGENTTRPALPAYGSLPAGEYVTVDTDPRLRAYARQVADGEVVVAVSQAEVDAAVADLRRTFLLISMGALVLLAVSGYALVRGSLRPLEEVERTAEVIATGALSQRVPVRRPGSEVGRLAVSLNAMLGQIEQAFHARARSEAAARESEGRMRQFVADASHELRTPLTSIRGYAELYRQGAVASPTQVAEVMSRIEGQSERMSALVEDLLLLASLDRQRPLELTPVDLAVIAVDAVHDARVVAPDRPITLHLDVGGAQALVIADEQRLRQVAANLVGNALRHTPPETAVEVRLRVEGDQAVFEVADHGPGLTPDQATRVFERFYRADPARTHDGTGLGLAIVTALIAAHGGEVHLTTTPGSGATFTVRLPLSPPASTGAGSP
ncbi:HAMP domain-containing sensor histidine kinase [Actinokineospora sp. NBRC 105648]|uniref:sensor histidine kinase n=1 Tax=Actinokineospora sp. NBRC 105648 TaxID=3032206 RepID=UPI0024A59A12|nr:HAMP domain-containing sensor histidine kinase [Actinokineospora sp. NBRC 105648]GLZ36562.1 two-component sensor histidine kinase [Actinokineospora sp. NBRC 105648]